MFLQVHLDCPFQSIFVIFISKMVKMICFSKHLFHIFFTVKYYSITVHCHFIFLLSNKNIILISNLTIFIQIHVYIYPFKIVKPFNHFYPFLPFFKIKMAKMNWNRQSEWAYLFVIVLLVYSYITSISLPNDKRSHIFQLNPCKISFLSLINRSSKSIILLAILKNFKWVFYFDHYFLISIYRRLTFYIRGKKLVQGEV